MLSFLRIQNYALIENLEINFHSGFSSITGETGAGKSVILGAIHLLLGNRVETSLLKDASIKSVIEAHWYIKEYNIEKIFEDNEVDYDDNTIIRREILPSGKSRAFVNDMPVNLMFLKDLGDKLIDIHSQHQNQVLNSSEFQLSVIDSSANNLDIKKEYLLIYNHYNQLSTELKKLKEKESKSKATYDYNSFLYNELKIANFSDSEQEELENEAKQLEHAEEIQIALSNATELFYGENIGIVPNLKSIINNFSKQKEYYSKAESFSLRIESVYLELQDIASEIEKENETIFVDPQKLQQVQDRLNLLFNLLQKHKVTTIAQLNTIKNKLEKELEETDNFSEKIVILEKEIEETKVSLEKIAKKLSESRMLIFSILEKELISLLQKLGMPNVRFCIENNISQQFTENGIDQISFLFSANKNAKLQNISDTASGGEISRVMLCLKYIISRHKALPTIIFDEIDTGVSGDIADKMGEIMVAMSENMQVVSITHLPQIAVKGKNQYLVFKYDSEHSTITNIKLLTEKERINEIAKMLSGSELSDAAIENAKQLLRNK